MVRTFSEQHFAFPGVQHMKELCTNGFQVTKLTKTQQKTRNQMCRFKDNENQ